MKNGQLARACVCVRVCVFYYFYYQDYYVVLLSAGEYDSYIKAICENPICQQRVIYIQGSALRFDDLVKVKVHYAECCFVLASRHAKDQQREVKRETKEFVCPSCYYFLMCEQTKALFYMVYDLYRFIRGENNQYILSL